MQHRNNFDLLRVCAALLVIFGHQLQLKSIGVPLPLGVPISKTGLDLFFSISGYLVTDSWLRTPDLLLFARKRALRILPGLALVVLATTFLLGPMITTLPRATYFASGETWDYLANIALHLENRLPGVFGTQKISAVNGSLWSLFPEMLCYATVPLLALLPRGPRLVVLLAGGLGISWFGFHMIATRPDWHPIIWGADTTFILAEAGFFFGGSFWRLLDRGSEAPYRIDMVILLCLLRGVMANNYATPGMMMDWVTLPYLVIAFGRARLPVLHDIARFGDISYGLYLYAFPMQQLMILLQVPHALPAALATTLLLAFASWHLIERPALRWKPKPRLVAQAA